MDATARMNQFVLQPRGVEVTIVFGCVVVLGVKMALLSIGGRGPATAKLPHDHMTALSASSKCSDAALYEIASANSSAFSEMRCGNLCSSFTHRNGEVRAALGPAKRCI